MNITFFLRKKEIVPDTMKQSPPGFTAPFSGNTTSFQHIPLPSDASAYFIHVSLIKYSGKATIKSWF